MSLLTKKEFNNYDRAVLYVTTCSDVEASFKNSRRFLECSIMVVVPPIGSCDRRYVVYCAESLREDIYKTGMFPTEAMVSEYSPFLMTKEFFEQLKEDPELREQYLQEVEDLILGTNIPEGLEYWQSEVNMIIKALDANVQDVIDDIRFDFTTDNMKIIPIKGVVPVKYQLSF